MAGIETPAIVVAAHSRPDELERLTRSIQRADVPAGTPLIISIDGGSEAHEDVRKVAHAIGVDTGSSQGRWSQGPLAIVEHEPLGLVEHFHRCGDLTSNHGSVILLEDDLLVGPNFYQWACAALAHGATDERIAGVSLAAPFHDGYRHLPFEPVVDGTDALFAQIPWYDGMAWTTEMWDRNRSTEVDPSTPIHRSFDELDDDEWFPDAIRYLAQTERFYVLPRHAHATNSGAVGAHFDARTDYFQVPLSLRAPADWRFAGLDDSLAVYDDHMELEPDVVTRLVPELVGYDLTIDLLGTRDLAVSPTRHVLTTRQTAAAIHTWGSAMHPLIANVAADFPGDSIRLAAIEDVITSPESDRIAQATLHHHATRGRKSSNRDAATQLLGFAEERIRRAFKR